MHPLLVVQVILDLVGAALSTWLGLHLLMHGWGWHRARARESALVLVSLTLLFALSAYRIQGGAPTPAAYPQALHLMLVPLPLVWLHLARRLSLGILQARSRYVGWLTMLLGGVTLVVPLAATPLGAEWQAYGWLFLPLYTATLLVAMVTSGLVAGRSRSILGMHLERRALAWLQLGSLLILVGGFLLAVDLVIGFQDPRLGAVTAWILPRELRFISTLGLFLAGFSLGQVVLSQARAEGAPHIERYRYSFLFTLLLTLFYLAVGGGLITLLRLPASVLALFLFLGILSELAFRVARTLLERLFYKQETGALRAALREVAEQVEEPRPIPAAVRPLLSRLARQLNVSQLGVALAEQNGTETVYRVLTAVKPSWEGELVDVRDPKVWEERSIGGWNMPLKQGEQTIGVLASDRNTTLNEVQQQLLSATAARIAELIVEEQALESKREALRVAVAEYREHSGALEKKGALLGAPMPLQQDLLKAVERALERYNDPDSLATTGLAGLSLVERLGGAGTASRAGVVQDLLFHLVEQLRPYEGTPTETPPAPEWWPYLILKHLYLDGEAATEWMIRLQLNERAFHRIRRSALAQVARVVADLEAGAIRLSTEQKALEGAASAPATGNSPFSRFRAPGRQGASASSGAETSPRFPSVPSVAGPNSAAGASDAPKVASDKSERTRTPSSATGALSDLARRLLPQAVTAISPVTGRLSEEKTGEGKQETGAPSGQPATTPPATGEKPTGNANSGRSLSSRLGLGDRGKGESSSLGGLSSRLGLAEKAGESTPADKKPGLAARLSSAMQPGPPDSREAGDTGPLASTTDDASASSPAPRTLGKSWSRPVPKPSETQSEATGVAEEQKEDEQGEV